MQLMSLQSIYERTLRPLLPKKIGMHAGVAIRKPRLLDMTDHFPQHNKQTLLEYCRDGISESDEVVVIGGGLGIAAVTTARQTGPSGSVAVYEAGQEEATRLEETMKLNAVAEWVEVYHAIVGKALSVNGQAGAADTVLPADLPQCDVLQLDCEGAERPILSSLHNYPEIVIVETHPRYGAPTDEIRDILSNHKYTVEQSEPDPIAGDVLLARRRPNC